MQLVSAGYGSAADRKTISMLMDRSGSVLLDCRLRPYSRWHAWSQSALQARYGSRYVHVPEWGNRRYRDRGPIEIVDLAQGMMRVMTALRASGADTVILMCGCADATRCHRSLLVPIVQVLLNEPRGGVSTMTNICVFVGRLGRDPDMAYTPEGRPFTRFSLAVDSEGKTASGEKYPPLWLNITCWDRLAEIVYRYCTKGGLVLVCGRLQVRSYSDRHGVERTAVGIVASQVKFLASPRPVSSVSLEEPSPLEPMAIPDEIVGMGTETEPQAH